MEPRTGLSMGQHEQITADAAGITRAQMDEVALASHQNLARAYDEGFFDDLVMPYHGLSQDNNLRRDTSLEKMAKLPGVFGGSGSLSAANSSPLTDGASAVLLSSEAWARERGLPVLARLAASATGAVDYVGGKEGLLRAPALYVVPKMLKARKLTLADLDQVEVHEAFASVVVDTLRLWEAQGLGSVDRAKLNAKGSSIAAGHPFAATGGRILGTLAKMLSRKNAGARGLISICAAGGQGVAAILERA
jgi:acetyl-CoA C-acetyltransferase